MYVLPRIGLMASALWGALMLAVVTGCDDHPHATAPVIPSVNIYVANGGANSVTVYAGASAGPVRVATLAGGNTGLTSPNGVVVDAAGKIYVTNVSSSG